MSKISVLIPVYNVKQFVSRCIDSVMSQTLTDIEIICINDGSTDGSGVILSGYANEDSRIKIISKENTGYGNSMNMGLEAATGEYIGIVESDDLIEPDFFENLYDMAKENDLDIVKSECKFVWPSQKYSYNYHAVHLEKYFYKVVPKDRLWLRCQFLMNVWAGLYRRDFIEKNRIRFNETPGASYQDNGFWMQCMIFADRVMFTDENGYLYCQDNYSSSVKDSRKVYAMSDEYEWLAKHLQGRITATQMNVVNAYRLIRGYWNFYRIDDLKKREYCNRLISDFNKYGDVFVIDLTKQELFYQLKNDPDGFCQRTIDAKRDIKERIEKAKSIIIYGAGNRGQRLFRLFCDYGFVEKLQCFVETASPKNNMVGTTLVIQISDKDIDWTDALVVISAADGSKMAGDMREKCNELAVTDVIGSDGFFNNYYMLT